MLLLVNSYGAKYLRLKYHAGSKQKTLALGVYATITLADASKQQEMLKKFISDIIDLAKKENKIDQVSSASAEKVARHYYSVCIKYGLRLIFNVC